MHCHDTAQSDAMKLRVVMMLVMMLVMLVSKDRQAAGDYL